MIDFEAEPEVETEETEVVSQEQTEGDENTEITANDSSQEIEGNAVTLFEDENYVFTTEGIVEKSSLQEQDNSSDAEPKEEPDEKILGKFENYDDLVESYKNLEKKLGQNSEAVNKLRELNPVLPMLEAMLGDETFLEMAENYFTDPEAQAEAFKKSIGVDDDFVFDLNNALSDPKSEDAKILNKLMQAKQPKSPQPQTQQQSNTTDEQTKKAVMEKYNMSEDDYNDMMSKAQDYKITHDDIYFLLNKDKILADAQKKGQSSVKKQVETAKRLKKPVSGGGKTPKTSPEDAFMSALQSGKGLFE